MKMDHMEKKEEEINELFDHFTLIKIVILKNNLKILIYL